MNIAAGSDDDGIPHVRMDVGPLRQFFPDPLNCMSPVADLASRGHPEDDEVTARNRLKVAAKALTDQRVAKQFAGLVEK